jgi:nucleotide-binding universal stress UspA family protein
VNLGSCSVNWKLNMNGIERVVMSITAVVLAAVWLTIAYTIDHALFFAICVLGIGLAVRAYSHKVVGLKTVTVSAEAAELVSAEAMEKLRPRCAEGSKVMVAARGVTPVLRFALDFASLKKATLCVLYVKEIAVFMGSSTGQTSRPKWQDDPHAAAIMSLCLKLGEETGVPVLPVFAVSAEPAATILDSAAMLGVDYLMLGAPHRGNLTRLLKGNVVEQVARSLPEDIELIIHS